MWTAELRATTLLRFRNADESPTATQLPDIDLEYGLSAIDEGNGIWGILYEHLQLQQPLFSTASMKDQVVAELSHTDVSLYAHAAGSESYRFYLKEGDDVTDVTETIAGYVMYSEQYPIFLKRTFPELSTDEMLSKLTRRPTEEHTNFPAIGETADSEHHHDGFTVGLDLVA